MKKVISIFRITAFLVLAVLVLYRVFAKDSFEDGNNMFVLYLLPLVPFCFLISFLLKIGPPFFRYLKNE